MKIILDDSNIKQELYPFTATRHAADIRIGILTIREKWACFPGFELYTEQTAISNAGNDAIAVEANLVPGREWLAALAKNSVRPDNTGFKTLQYPWQIFQYNEWALREDFEMITWDRNSQKLSDTNKVIGDGGIFLEEGARLEYSILNTSSGPVYIGKNAEVQEGCMIRGPFALCEGAVLKMGSKVYGATTIGPYSTAAGEIKNSVIFGFSNKGHDGYLGDSVIGEWCNLGAGTSNSNVKNSAGDVKVWSRAANNYLSVGLKSGLLMGDYSRSAINTSFNTGTVVGVCCNIFNAHFPPKLVDDFTWGTEKYMFDKAIRDISNWKKLKGKAITPEEINILQQLYTKQ